MSCQWERDDCQNIDSNTCLHCFNGDKYREPKKRHYGLRQRSQSGDKRQGSSFEVAAHRKNIKDLAHLTINSGATQKEKGDELVDGLAPLMIEYKTQMDYRAKGTKSFAIKREWLNKLNREARERGREFWVLKFAYSEAEGSQQAGKEFAVLEDSMFQRMYACILSDRTVVDECDAKLKLYKRRYERSEADNTALRAKIEELEAELNLYKIRLKKTKEGGAE